MSRLKQLIPLAALAISLALSACEDHTPVPPPVVQANPAIRKRYELLLDPGTLPVHAVSGRAFFNIMNQQQCVKMDYSMALGGVHPTFTQVVDIAFRLNEVNQFTAVLIRDPFKDADYYGKGLCHWDLTNVVITLTAGVPQQIVSLSREDLSNDLTQHEHNEYCAAEPNYTHPPPINFCELDLGRLVPEKRNHFYEVTIYNRRVSP